MPAVLLDGRGPANLNGFVSNTVVRDGYNTGFATRGLTSTALYISLTGNVVYNMEGSGYSLQSTIEDFSSNLAVAVQRTGIDARSISTLHGNVVVGAGQYGFRVSPELCSSTTFPTVLNSAHACAGSCVHIVSDSAFLARCGRVQGFMAMKGRGKGFSSLLVGSLTISNVVSIDNAVHFSLDAELPTDLQNPLIRIEDATMIARVGSDGSDGACVWTGDTIPPTIVGVVSSRFYAPGYSFAVPRGHLEVADTMFVNFRGQADTCGSSNGFSTSSTTSDTMAFMTLAGISSFDSGQATSLNWYLPPMSAYDGDNHIVIEDTDGTLAGVPNNWLVTRNVGMAIGCTLLTDYNALRCADDHEFVRLMIRPVRAQNVLNTGWGSMAVESKLTDNPCNGNANSLGSLRPGCDIIHSADSSETFWVTMDANEEHRVRFSPMAGLVASTQLTISKGTNGRPSTVTATIVDVVYPPDNLHLYFVWIGGQRRKPKVSDLSVSDAAGTYKFDKQSNTLSVVLHIDAVVEVRAERALQMELVVRDLDGPSSNGLSTLIATSLGHDAADVFIESFETEAVNILTNRVTVRANLFESVPLAIALDMEPSAMSCGDRFTAGDEVNQVRHAPMPVGSFGHDEREWIITYLIKAATALQTGCNDPNAENYEISATDHDRTTCTFQGRCEILSPELGTTASDVESGAALMLLLERVVTAAVQRTILSSTPTEFFSVNAWCLADGNIAGLSAALDSAGVSVSGVTIETTVVTLESSLSCKRATATLGLSSCFGAVGKWIRLNTIMFGSIQDADAYIGQRVAGRGFLDDQTAECRAVLTQVLCADYLGECDKETLCTGTCDRAFDLCQLDSMAAPEQRCAGYTSMISATCGYDISFACPVNHHSYPLCYFSVHGVVLTGSARYAGCEVTVVGSTIPENEVPAVASATDGRFELGHDSTVDEASARLVVKTGPSCRSILTDRPLVRPPTY